MGIPKKTSVPLKTVLIVEDDELIRKCLLLYLQGLPIRPWEEKDGVGALHLARQIRPDLIITDLTMPLMDGVQLTKEVRADAELSKCPVIIFTGTSSEHQQLARQAGANIVLEKPSPRKTVLAAVDNFLKFSQ